MFRPVYVVYRGSINKVFCQPIQKGMHTDKNCCMPGTVSKIAHIYIYIGAYYVYIR